MRKKGMLSKQGRPTFWGAGVMLLVLSFLFTSPALAHRVVIFAYTEGDIVHTESKFMPHTPVKQGKILVLDAQTGKELLTGQTDDQGKFSFKIPPEAQKQDLKIVVEAAMGHRGEWLLKAKR